MGQPVRLFRLRLHCHAVLPKRLAEVVAKITGGGRSNGTDKLPAANDCLHDVVLRSRFGLVRLSESQPVGRSRFGDLDLANDRVTFVAAKIPFRTVRMGVAIAELLAIAADVEDWKVVSGE